MRPERLQYCRLHPTEVDRVSGGCGPQAAAAPGLAQSIGPDGKPLQTTAGTLRTRVEAGEKRAELAREFGISRETLYQYVPLER